MVGRALGYTSEPSTKGLLGRSFSRGVVRVMPGRIGREVHVPSLTN